MIEPSRLIGFSRAFESAHCGDGAISMTQDFFDRNDRDNDPVNADGRMAGLDSSVAIDFGIVARRKS